MKMGYVVEQFVSAERVLLTVADYTKVLADYTGAENEVITDMREYVANPPAPYWLGTKGFTGYQDAKYEKSKMESAIKDRKWRVVKARMPQAGTWIGYEVIPW